MRTSTLVRRNLTYYRRTNLAVVFGVAVAVSVLAGAALVGESVRASLRELFLERIGKTDYLVASGNFFRQQLAAGFPSACPMIALEGLVIQPGGGQRASHVAVYGVDARFWSFHGRAAAAAGPRDALLSPALSTELAARAGDPILVRVEKQSAIPAEWLHGRKDDAGRTMSFRVQRVLREADLGEFSLKPEQGPVRAVFLPLARVQQDLEQPGRVNTILIQGPSPEATLKARFALTDLGIRMRVLAARNAFSVESDGALISDALAAAVRSAATALGMDTEPVFTYLANTIRAGGHEIPYSLISALDLKRVSPVPGQGIVLNDWAARDLAARAGDTVTLEYYVWKDEGRLATEKAQLTLTAIVSLLDDRDLAPEYPGMTGSESLHDWDPPFPVDLGRVRPRDEDYWKKYRTTPKGFIPLETGQKMWGSRFGKLTSIRLAPKERQEAFEQRLRATIDPLATGFFVVPVRAQGLAAAQGATDFGEYFLYFSFFLVISALVLTGLFFRLGIEQRLREIGTLRAMGFAASRIRNVFLAEGLVLATAGSLLGAAGAAVYGGLVLLGLRTWWIGAVGTRALSLHVTAGALAGGAAAGIVTALLCVAVTLRGLRSLSPLVLLTGTHGADGPRRGTGHLRLVRVSAAVTTLGAAGLLAASATKMVGRVEGFFGAGALLLAACLFWQRLWLSGGGRQTLRDVAGLGLRNAGHRPGRSILCISLIAFATFVIVAVGAFREEAAPSPGDPKAGDGGYSLLAESILPVFYDLNTKAGRESLNLAGLDGVRFTMFRLRPGDDASCLNLYQPRNPRVLAPPDAFLREGRFRFQDAMATAPETPANPWLLLDETQPDGAIPAIVDANTLLYALHLKLGDVFVLNAGMEKAVRLRLVAALQDSIFQSELLISEQNFRRAFPDQQGYRFFLIDVPSAQASAVSRQLEEALTDYGFDARPAAERLAGFHRVENTYLATFQTLGSLGLLLGTVGLAAVMLRNVLERRRELALLEAVGFRPGDLATMILAENVFLLVSGLGVGTVSALLAIVPAAAERGGHFPVISIALLLVAVLATGLLASLAAMRVVARAPLLAALRAE